MASIPSRIYRRAGLHVDEGVQQGAHTGGKGKACRTGFPAKWLTQWNSQALTYLARKIFIEPR